MFGFKRKNSKPAANPFPQPTMLDRKLQLHDLFEGCFDKATALAMAGLDKYPSAAATWDRWTRELEETGSYTF